jgi:hypothetical protein
VQRTGSRCVDSRTGESGEWESLLAAKGYDLEMAGRVSHPYDSPGYGDLVGHPKLQLTYHHTVPNSRLMEFWNTTLDSDSPGRQKFLRAFAGNVARYPFVARPERAHTREPDLKQVADLAGRMSRGRIFHDPGKKEERPGGWDNFWSLYVWMPGNLFKGPQRRGDDPEDEFENMAGSILRDRFALLSLVNQNMSEYLAGTGGNAAVEAAYTGLSKVATDFMYRNFNNKFWTWSTEKNLPVIAER